MTARLFRSMTPDRDSVKAARFKTGPGLIVKEPVTVELAISATTRCDRCGTVYGAGSWPWCRGPGHEEDHKR